VSVVDMIRGAGAHHLLQYYALVLEYVSRAAPDACPKGY